MTHEALYTMCFIMLHCVARYTQATNQNQVFVQDRLKFEVIRYIFITHNAWLEVQFSYWNACSMYHAWIYVYIIIYSTAQRQLDTRTCATGWILSGKDYIMRSIFEWMPCTFVPASGKLSGMCTHEHRIIFYELLNEYYNINSI